MVSEQGRIVWFKQVSGDYAITENGASKNCKRSLSDRHQTTLSQSLCGLLHLIKWKRLDFPLDMLNVHQWTPLKALKGGEVSMTSRWQCRPVFSFAILLQPWHLPQRTTAHSLSEMRWCQQKATLSLFPSRCSGTQYHTNYTILHIHTSELQNTTAIQWLHW